MQKCDLKTGRLLVKRSGEPVVEKVSYRQRGQYWQQLALTNQTDHVIRVNQVAIRVLDPGGNLSEPLTKDDLNARLLSERPCPSTQQAINQFRAIKVFDRNMEIVPGTTATFWVAFAPPSLAMPGVWKFTIYEVPVKVDQAGRTTRATRFDMRVVATQIVNTYTQESPFAEPKLVDTKEVTPQLEGSDSQRPEGSGPKSTTVQPVSQSASPALPLSPTKDMISRAQVELKARGFDPGPPDGSMGTKTREALRRFQNAHRLRGTGELDTATLDTLGVR